MALTSQRMPEDQQSKGLQTETQKQGNKISKDKDTIKHTKENVNKLLLNFIKGKLTTWGRLVTGAASKAAV